MAIVKCEFWSDFIKLYHNQPALWCVSDDLYKNAAAKQRGWNLLLQKYKEYDPNASLDSVKKKINAMRFCYKNELRKLRDSEESAVKLRDVYIPTLWYFDEIDFLRDVEVKLEEGLQDGSLEEAEFVELFSKAKQCSLDNLEILSGTNKSDTNLSTARICDVSDILSTRARNDVEMLTNPSKDDAEIFSESWAVLFRKLSFEQQIYAKRAIEEILFQGQLGTLSIASVRFK